MLVYFYKNNTWNRPWFDFTKHRSRPILRRPFADSTGTRTASLKPFKCRPRFPLRRQNKEATRSTPRAAPDTNTGPFSTQQLADPTFRRKRVFLAPTRLLGRSFICLLHNIRGLDEVDCGAMAAAVVGASGAGCYIHPVLGTALSTNGPRLP